MNIYQQGFREDILNAIFKLSTKTWLKITGAYAIQYFVGLVIALVIILPMFASVISLDDIAEFQSNPQVIFDFSEKIEQLVTDSPSIILGIIAFVIVILIVYSWAINFQLKISDSQVKKDKADFGEIFRGSFNNEVLKTWFAILLIYLIVIVLFAIAGYAGSISGFLAFLLFLVVMVISTRFFLVIPALIIGKLTLSEAFAWSLQKITWVRALKLFLAGLLATVILLVIAVIIGLISMIFAIIPFLGMLVQWGINIFFGGFMAALFTAAMIGLYYRYAEDIPDNPEGNLEMDDLLISDK